MSEIANQLKSQTLGDVIAPAFETVGSRVFPDLNSTTDILDLIKIVDSWRATHVQTYGNVLPNSGQGVAFDGTQDLILSANDNEVVKITGISFENTGLSNIEYNLLFGDGANFAALIYTNAIASGETQIVQDLVSTIVSKGYDLRLQVTSGGASDLIGNISYCYTCQ